MTDDELELAILNKYVALHQDYYTAELPSDDKCAREIDMREVLRELTSDEGAKLSYKADLWFGRLVEQSPRASKGLLRPCSNSELKTGAHKYHARAFKDPTNNAPAPAWDRIRELQEKVSKQRPVAPTKEREQKFGILLSFPQAQRDFDNWCADAKEQELTIGVLYVDIDRFKSLNERHTETVIDKTIMPEAQTLLRRLTAHRGGAYRYGGEEFVALLPNHSLEETLRFAEKVRKAFESNRFRVYGSDEAVTVSIGVAIWPNHGETLGKVVEAANEAEHSAKRGGRNTVREAAPNRAKAS